MKLASTYSKKKVVSDLDDVLCDTSLQWYAFMGISSPEEVWHRKHWDIFHDPKFGNFPYISGDCYDNMTINPLAKHLIQKAVNGEIQLFITSSGFSDTDASKQRLMDRCFPKCVNTNIVPHGKDKGTFIKEVLGLHQVDIFIDDKLENHEDLLRSGITCDLLVAPLTPFTINHKLKSSSGKALAYYTPTVFCQESFKSLPF